jgi:GntR family transcriptional repressor for pyruvate dehydrogenase complex
MPPVKARDAGSVAAGGHEEPRTCVKARRVRSFDDVVEQVRAAIIDGSITAGERLPSERDLAEQFGVSRATLREALRALEAVGLVEIRVGARGGAFATDGDVHRSVDSLRRVFEVEEATRPAAATRFRASVHADNAAWAGHSSDDIRRLRESAAGGARTFLVTLAELSGMPLRVALAAAVESEDRDDRSPSMTPSQMERVVDLLERGDRAGCRELVFRHLSDPDGPESR